MEDAGARGMQRDAERSASPRRSALATKAATFASAAAAPAAMPTRVAPDAITALTRKFTEEFGVDRELRQEILEQERQAGMARLRDIKERHAQQLQDEERLRKMQSVLDRLEAEKEEELRAKLEEARARQLLQAIDASEYESIEKEKQAELEALQQSRAALEESERALLDEIEQLRAKMAQKEDAVPTQPDRTNYRLDRKKTAAEEQRGAILVQAERLAALRANHERLLRERSDMEEKMEKMMSPRGDRALAREGDAARHPVSSSPSTDAQRHTALIRTRLAAIRRAKAEAAARDAAALDELSDHLGEAVPAGTRGGDCDTPSSPDTREYLSAQWESLLQQDETGAGDVAASPLRGPSGVVEAPSPPPSREKAPRSWSPPPPERAEAVATPRSPTPHRSATPSDTPGRAVAAEADDDDEPERPGAASPECDARGDRARADDEAVADLRAEYASLGIHDEELLREIEELEAVERARRPTNGNAAHTAAAPPPPRDAPVFSAHAPHSHRGAAHTAARERAAPHAPTGSGAPPAWGGPTYPTDPTHAVIARHMAWQRSLEEQLRETRAQAELTRVMHQQEQQMAMMQELTRALAGQAGAAGSGPPAGSAVPPPSTEDAIQQEIARLARQRELQTLRHELEATEKEHKRRMWIEEQRQQLLEARFRKQLRVEGVSHEAATRPQPQRVTQSPPSPPAPDAQHAEVYAFIDFVEGLPSRIKRCSVLLGDAALQRGKQLAVADAEDPGQFVFACEASVPVDSGGAAPVGASTATQSAQRQVRVLEFRGVDAQGRTGPLCWTVLPAHLALSAPQRLALPLLRLPVARESFRRYGTQSAAAFVRLVQRNTSHDIDFRAEAVEPDALRDTFVPVSTEELFSAAIGTRGGSGAAGAESAQERSARDVDPDDAPAPPSAPASPSSPAAAVSVRANDVGDSPATRSVPPVSARSTPAPDASPSVAPAEEDRTAPPSPAGEDRTAPPSPPPSPPPPSRRMSPRNSVQAHEEPAMVREPPEAPADDPAPAPSERDEHADDGGTVVPAAVYRPVAQRSAYTERFAQDDGCDVVLDGFRHLPFDCGLSVVRVYAVRSSGNLVPIGGTDDSAAYTEGDAATKRWRDAQRAPLRIAPALDSTTTFPRTEALIEIREDRYDPRTLLVVELLSIRDGAVQSLGYCCFPLFVPVGGTSASPRPPRAADTAYALREGAFQCAIYWGVLPRMETVVAMDGIAVAASPARVPGASALVRVRRAPRTEDGLEVASRASERRAVLEGAVSVRAPPYEDGVYDTAAFFAPSEAEVALLANRAASEPARAISDAYRAERIAATRTSGDGDAAALRTDAEKREWIVRAAERDELDNAVALPLRRVSPYAPGRGFLFRAVRLLQAPKAAFYTAIFSLCPPGSYYNEDPFTEEAYFTHEYDLDSDSKSIVWKDDSTHFRFVPYSPGLGVLVDIRRVDFKHGGSLVPVGWAYMPVFLDGEPFVRSGSWILPVWKGKITTTIVESMRDASSPLTPAQVQKNTRVKALGHMSVEVHLVDALLAPFGVSAAPERITELLPRGEEAKYLRGSSSKPLAKSIPSTLNVHTAPREANQIIVRETYIQRYNL